MNFASYMRDWLYGKEGYYRYSNIGKKGDFYTSVCVSKFFGGSIAFYLLRQLEEKKLKLPLKIVEIGADKAQLISDIAQFLQVLSEGVLQECEFISIEPLDELANLQKDNFLRHTGFDLKSYFCFKDLKLKENDCVFIVCNEVFDALVCEVIYEGKMAYVDKHQVVWKDISPEISSLMGQYQIFKGELPIELESFISEILENLEKCEKWEFLIFDYGQWEARNDINLRVYQNHQVKNFFEVQQNLESYYQKCDVTYDVNFSLLHNVFTSLGAKQLFYMPQGKALIELGLLDLLEKFAQTTSYKNYLREVAKVKTLISPGGLGERFQTISFKNQ
ncbi:SAM-dependent methyltransferase [Helicobacter sp. 11S03491-1]|uniref:SAM-dependent methyltransferase n=1 Tax=Helicobacter sp. 11S03491-1 TaxID=1476196 RepID=UPI000BA7C2B1|nr:SAM-dependent methyltransferase [Helicobacter sp. 11S03491-1]PAF41872.1 SAM-dependent methyltransferase [Helicobacter sp. 11S03491-1]